MPRFITEIPLAEGVITQIDYDDDHGSRITRICFHDPLRGQSTEVRFTYPEPDWGDDMAGRNPVVILPPKRGPEVRVVRLA